MSEGYGTSDGARLRLARQARGFTRQQLAAMAGVSRQAVSIDESGLSGPSLRVALALASALGMTVQKLFEPGVPVVPVTARPVAPPGGEGARVALASIGHGYVPLPLRGNRASRGGFIPAGGLIAGTDGSPGNSRLVRLTGSPRPTPVAAGCDPALPLMETSLGAAGSAGRVQLVAVPEPGGAAAGWACPAR